MLESKWVKVEHVLPIIIFFFFNKLFIAYLLSSHCNCCLCSQTYADRQNEWITFVSIDKSLNNYRSYNERYLSDKRLRAGRYFISSKQEEKKTDSLDECCRHERRWWWWFIYWVNWMLLTMVSNRWEEDWPCQIDRRR
jgi:hypothetical protein